MSYITYSHHLNILVGQALELAEKYPNGLWIIKPFGMEWFEMHNEKPHTTSNKIVIHIPFFCLFSKTLYPAERRIINKAMRLIDDSRLWPIRNKFNATDRAIRRANKYEQDGGVFDCGYSYWKFLEQELSGIVNGEI